MTKNFGMKELAIEERGDRNRQLKEALQQRLPGGVLQSSPPNPARLCRMSASQIKLRFKKEYRRSGPQEGEGPLAEFLHENLEHPEMPYLLTVLE